MPDFSFLPTFPTELNLLAAAGLILVAGILGARLVSTMLPVPAITGYVLTGLLIGPAGLGLISADMLAKFGLLIDLALGLVLFELGRRVDYRWLVREKRLLATGLLISVSAFAALYWLLIWFGVDKLLASMVAALGMATSPAVTLNVVREVKAEGQLTERMLNIVAIGNALAFVVFSMGLSVLHLEYQAGWRSYVIHPIYLLFGSALLGWIASRLLIWGAHWLGRDSQARLILMLALIATTVGVAMLLKLSALIALLAFGLAGRSRDPRHTVIEPDFSQFSTLFYVLLFVYAGARLELSHLPSLAPIVLSFIALRFIITIFWTTTTARLNTLTWRKGVLLGVTLFPLSGFKIVVVQQAAALYPEFSNQLLALMISILVITEIAGPICTRYALLASGEAKTDAAAPPASRS